MRQKIRTREYVVTLHAEEEMADEGLTVLDLERIVLTGRIVKRQKDSQTGEWKYIVKGRTFSAKSGSIVAKIGPTDILIVITVFGA